MKYNKDPFRILFNYYYYWAIGPLQFLRTGLDCENIQKFFQFILILWEIFSCYEAKYSVDCIIVLSLRKTIYTKRFRKFHRIQYCIGIKIAYSDHFNWNIIIVCVVPSEIELKVYWTVQRIVFSKKKNRIVPKKHWVKTDCEIQRHNLNAKIALLFRIPTVERNVFIDYRYSNSVLGAIVKFSDITSNRELYCFPVYQPFRKRVHRLIFNIDCDCEKSHRELHFISVYHLFRDTCSSILKHYG